MPGRYYVRVSAENTVPFQDNNRVYGFSTPRFAITADMPPLAPTSVTLYEYTGSSVLVRVGVPLGSGGQVCAMCARTRSRSPPSLPTISHAFVTSTHITPSLPLTV